MTAIHPSETCAELYRAILADPEDDTVRLAWADALEEAGDEERAEFVRAQVELAKWPIHKQLHDTTGEGRVLFKSRGGPDYYEFTMATRDEVVIGDRVDFPRHGKEGKKPRILPGLRVVRIVGDDRPANPATVIACRDEYSKTQAAKTIALRSRSSTIHAKHEATWRRGARCERCGGTAREPIAPRDSIISKWTVNCLTCHGLGWMGSLGDRQTSPYPLSDSSTGTLLPISPSAE